MATESLPRKLAAILYADVSGYSRLMSQDERATVETLTGHREIFFRHVDARGGRVVDTAGDSVLALFDSIVETLRCAVDVLAELEAANAALADDRKMHFRVGVNLGDVITDGDAVYGDGINIAARLESIAEPGGICISEAVRFAVRGKVDFEFDDMGAQALKNIEEPVRAFGVRLTSGIPLSPDVEAAATDSSELPFSPPVRPSVAILPFKSIGSSPEIDCVADGIRFGIQATLVQLSGLFLVNASTLNAYRDASAVTAGSELDVDYVLEGVAQGAGDRIRVTVQLTDTRAGRTTWAERYDRVIDDVFQLQDEITGEVISALNIQLQFGDVGRGWFGRIKSPEARACYHQGASHLYRGTKEDNAEAREQFEGFHRAEPDSVIGPSNIAVTHWLDAFFGWSDDPAASREQARKWAEKAISYEDNNGIGHAVLGHLKLREGAHQDALDLCSEGVLMRSSCPLARGLLGMVLTYTGSPREAIREIRTGLHLERVYPPWLIDVLAVAYRDAGELGLSIAAAEESLRLDPDKNDARLILCTDFKLAEDDDRAGRLADEVVDREPSFRVSTYAEGLPYKDPAPRERIVNALRDAGLPE